MNDHDPDGDRPRTPETEEVAEPDPAGRTADERRDPRASLENIGPYRIIGPLGSGGMGTVYEAEQQSPIRRRVAIKLIRATAATDTMLRRFDAERQVIALMDHPHIARVFDAGATDLGEPYFSMELVDGDPISRYCDERRLSVDDRLSLFLAVCDGVKHAHQKGVIHRDLKPSNVLVTGGDPPTPKIIDFGIAKALDEHLIDGALLTGDSLLGTPAYMSPERLRRVADVDTRGDVYSLGVMLYELLTGALPFGWDTGNPWEEMNRALTDEPPTPCSQVTGMDRELLERTASARSTDCANLKRRLAGDLNWITLRAMAKERDQRYESAAELAADIRRHLDHHPVIARPPSRVYRAKKFIRRHRVGVAAAALVVIAIAGGVIGTMAQAKRVEREAERANREAEVAQQVSGFLIDLFRISNPSESNGSKVTARELLDVGAKRAGTELADQPLLRARFQNTMGSAYRQLGLYEEAISQLESALATRRSEPGGEDRFVSQTAAELAEVLHKMNRPDEALPLAEESLTILQALSEQPTVGFCERYSLIGSIHSALGNSADALAWFERSVALADQLGLPSAALRPLNNAARLYHIQGDHDKAVDQFTRTLELSRQLNGEESFATAVIEGNLGAVLLDSGRYVEAVEHIERSVSINEHLLPQGHPWLAAAWYNLAIALRAEGRFDEARHYYQMAFETLRDRLGPDDPNLLRVHASLALLAVDQDRLDDAESHCSRVLAIAEAVPDRKKIFPQGAECLCVLGGVHARLDRKQSAERLLRGGLRLAERAYGTNQENLSDCRTTLQELLEAQGRRAEAAAIEPIPNTGTDETISPSATIAS